MSGFEYWLALNSLDDIGPVVARRLLSTFGNPENIFQMPAEELRKVEGVGDGRVRSIVDFDQWDPIKREIDRADKNGVTLLLLHDQAYPEALRQIHDAPIVLYVKGSLKDADKYAIAMVGSRNATNYGIQVAEKMSHKLASSGLTIVSGMARGIDAVSHRGALKAGGRTIAVLGSGIDVPYPASNRGLMRAIESSAAVMSEFPFGTPPSKENFPKRNRIISALSFGVIVVEAALDSGSLITVGYALEQGREVFAVPGNVTSRASKGTNDLIKKGARLVESSEEVINELRPLLKGVLGEDISIQQKTLPSMSDDERLLYQYLSSEPKHIDVITREFNLTTGRALSVLLTLELKGVIKQTEGKCFLLN